MAVPPDDPLVPSAVAVAVDALRSAATVAGAGTGGQVGDWGGGAERGGGGAGAGATNSVAGWPAGADAGAAAADAAATAGAGGDTTVMNRVAAAIAGAPTPAGATGAGPTGGRGGRRPPPVADAGGGDGLSEACARASASLASASWRRWANPAASSRRLAVSRAWAIKSNARIAKPTMAANPASAPTDEMRLCTDRANGIDAINGAV